MAKSLQEQIASAESTDRVTIATLAELIASVTAERDGLSAAHVKASADSVDFRLSEEDRDEAARNAERHTRNASAMAAALVRLEAKLAEKRASETHRAHKAEQEAARAERDQLASEFKDLVQPAVAAMVALFQKIEANSDRLSAAGVREPNAEAKARGLVGFLGLSDSPLSYLQMKLPSFDGAGRCWPPDQLAALAAKVGQSSSQIRADQVASRDRAEAQRRAAAEEHVRSHGTYELRNPICGYEPLRLPLDIVASNKRLPHGVFHGDPWEGEVSHTVAEELRAVPNLIVKRLDPAPAR